METRAQYELSVVAQIRAAVMLSANPARAVALDCAILTVMRRDFAWAINNLGLAETACCLERLIESKPDGANARKFRAAVQAEFERRDALRVAA